MSSSQQPGLLFTAFEPSGDDHAAAVIRELRRRHPDLPIYAWGGPHMRNAGAQIIEQTGDDAVVGLPGWETIKRYRRIQQNIAQWISEGHAAVHIPVDSPAANFPICRLAKKGGLKVIHLVAPQLWAWGSWRIWKLKRRTDMVLCLLPFEEEWFEKRGVRARFVGHPLFDEPLDLDEIGGRAEKLVSGSPKVALLPGSRPAELRRNFPVMLNTFKELRKRHGELVGVVGATTEEVRESLYERANALGGWPEGLDIVVGDTDLVIRWCDLALVVSGTVTLQIAKQARPMVIMYKTNELSYKLVGRWVISTKFFALPNLIAGKEIIPELIPYFTGIDRLLTAAERLISDPAGQQAQRRALRDVAAKFAGKVASAEAASAIEELAGLTPGAASAAGGEAVAAIGAAHES